MQDALVATHTFTELAVTRRNIGPASSSVGLNVVIAITQLADNEARSFDRLLPVVSRNGRSYCYTRATELAIFTQMDLRLLSADACLLITARNTTEQRGLPSVCGLSARPPIAQCH